MSNEIETLEQEKRVAEELLFLVLDKIGEPVTLDIEDSKQKLTSDKIISIDLDADTGVWVLQVVNASDAVN